MSAVWWYIEGSAQLPLPCLSSGKTVLFPPTQTWKTGRMDCSCSACLLCCFSSHMVDDTHIQSGSPSSVKPLSGNFFPETRSCVLSGSKPHHDGKEVDRHPHWARALYWWWHLRVSVFNSVTEYYVKMNELLDETFIYQKIGNWIPSCIACNTVSRKTWGELSDPGHSKHTSWANARCQMPVNPTTL